MVSTIAILKKWSLVSAFLYYPDFLLVRHPISPLSRNNLYRHNLASHNSLHTQKLVENQNTNKFKRLIGKHRNNSPKTWNVDLRVRQQLIYFAKATCDHYFVILL